MEAGVEKVMGAYNRTLDEPCCASKFLMEDILRGRWNFQGHYVSDCWAVRDFHEHHKVMETSEQSVALAVNTGCDVNCGCTYEYLVKVVKQGLLDEKKVALMRLFRTRFKLGMFDPPEQNPYSSLDEELLHCEQHRNLARTAALKSMVLLKNDNNILPQGESIIIPGTYIITAADSTPFASAVFCIGIPRDRSVGIGSIYSNLIDNTVFLESR